MRLLYRPDQNHSTTYPRYQRTDTFDDIRLTLHQRPEMKPTNSTLSIEAAQFQIRHCMIFHSLPAWEPTEAQHNHHLILPSLHRAHPSWSLKKNRYKAHRLMHPMRHNATK